MVSRQLIFDTAAKTTGIGELEETLKWGEPSYLTPETKSGSTVRINPKEMLGDSYASLNSKDSISKDTMLLPR